MPKIFISYGRDGSHGQNLATEAQDQLQSAGYEVFRDATGLKGGDFWLRKLEREIRSSELVILILSKKVLDSKWVPNEISLAEDLDIPVVPVFAEIIELPLWLRHLQVIDFSGQNNWQQLFDDIAGHIEIPRGIDKAGTIHSISVNDYIMDKDEKPVSDYEKYLLENYSNRMEVDRRLDQYKTFIRSKKTMHLQVPSWASHASQDQYGHYADLDINNVTQRFRLINPGTFQMGSPETEKERESWGKETLHQATISNAFWLADTACTQALWQAVMGKNPAYFTANVNNPVEQVSWNDVQVYCQALARLKPGLLFQLPTEAQWEYACRAGTSTPFSFGEDITPNQVNYDGNYSYINAHKALYRQETVPVKSLMANSWGFYEMHGNVWEWCQDSYQENLGDQPCIDPITNSEDRLDCVLRGGSWSSNSQYCRSATRNRRRCRRRYNGVGFRLCLVN